MSNNSDIQKHRLTAAQILALAVKSMYKGVKLGSYGVTEYGFYYDFKFPESFGTDQLESIYDKMKEIVANSVSIKSNYKIKDDLLAVFTSKKSPYKNLQLQEYSKKRIDTISIGEKYLDICSDKLLDNTSDLGVFYLEEVSGAYWRGSEENDMLTRISGVCFINEDDYNKYLEKKEDKLRRDHRVLGKKLKYFNQDSSLGQGLVSWNVRGAFLKNLVEKSIKRIYSKIGISLVETPIVSKRVQNIPAVQPKNEAVIVKQTDDESDSEDFVLRQQMLDGHMVLFNSFEQSYRDLPWRIGEIGKVIRYERSGTLEGLNRLREMTQDNISIVCAREHVEKELEVVVSENLTFLRDIGLVNFAVKLSLPSPDTKAQKQENLLISGAMSGISRKLNFVVQPEILSEDLADPEITIEIKDSLDQIWEISKVQIISSFPISRGITYTGKDGEGHIPYIIRATVSGSVERLIALLIEHYAGVLPLWLMYEQVRVLSVTSNQEMYAEKVVRILHEAGIRATLDLSSDILEAKIKQAEEDKIPYMLVVGEKEANTSGVSVRIHQKGDIGLLDLDTFTKSIQQELTSKSIKSLL